MSLSESGRRDAAVHRHGRRCRHQKRWLGGETVLEGLQGGGVGIEAIYDPRLERVPRDPVATQQLIDNLESRRVRDMGGIIREGEGQSCLDVRFGLDRTFRSGSCPDRGGEPPEAGPPQFRCQGGVTLRKISTGDSCRIPPL